MDWKRGPPVLVGEKVLWSGNTYSKPVTGVIKWIGNIPEISSDWCVGIESEVALPGIGGDGFWKGRELFQCRSKHGLLVPIEEIHKLRSKSQFATTSTESHPHFKLDGSQLRDFTLLSSLRCKPQKEIKKTQIKNRYSKPESKLIEESFNNSTSDSGFDSQKEKRKSASEVLGAANTDRQSLKLDDQDFKNLPRNDTDRINWREELEKPKSESSAKPNVKDVLENAQAFDSRTSVHEFLKNMNEIAGYFKELKEGDERFEKHEQTDNNGLCDSNESGHSKPKKLFSFLKWFNKKHKHEPNLKLFQETSPPSSPMFPRRETSSCDSLDTLFSTQTVRSFAYIPPTQYKPSAPPLDFEEFPEPKNTSEEAESTYDRRKKRKAPEPPRLTRENSLPSTLERKTTEDDDYGKSFHRRTVSESFKDKKAGSYCHVQGKRKAPPPPSPQFYPNLQKMNSQYPSLHKKKKPAPPPPESFYENTTKTDAPKEKETDEPKFEKPKEGKEEKEMKINQMFKDGLIKDASLSPLPSRPWYKRSHRDSTGSNIIKKDLLKGFEKKKNKETDDWMPEVGFPRRSLSTETHSKFNIFSKLEKTEDKKKEEKRKSQISILTNISELDREAAEIVRKEQAEEKKMMAENDERYYSPKGLREKIHEQDETLTNPTENFKVSNKTPNKQKSNKTEGKSYSQIADKISEPRAIGFKDTKMGRGESTIDEHPKTKEETLKDKENNLNSDSESNGNPKQNLFSPNVLADLTNSSSQSPPGKIPKPAQDSSQARLNFFNVQNKELSYLNEPWVCQKCTLENPGWRVFCEICSSVKPRFTFNKSATETKITTDKEVKRQPAIDKPSPAAAEPGKSFKPKFAAGEAEQTTQRTPPTAENEKEIKPVETLDELRKKRMNFFSSQSETQKTEPEPLSDDPDKTRLKKTLKEMKDSLPEKISVEENTEKRDQEIEEKKKNEMEEERQAKEKEEQSDEKQIREKQEEERKEKEAKRKPEAGSRENAFITTVGEVHREDQQQPVKPTPGSASNNSAETEQIAEAYVITKTIVLEDIIVKKPDRGRKVSASVQTKSSLTGAPDSKVVRPPPRTKKIVLSEIEKGTEPELYSEVQKRPKNYKQEDLEELTSRLTKAEGLADFRAKIETMPLNTEMNTVAVNRLLRKLEAAINCGDQFVAAGLAKELALMKINCSVTRQITPSPGPSKITVDLYIEDKVSHQGPIPLEVSPTMSLLQLKKKIHKEFGIPLEVQRWILGKKLATDDNKTLEIEGVNTDYCPLFLYLVAPENPKTDHEATKKAENKSEPNQNRQSTEPVSSPKGKGWYYNYEEDHYSYCEDSDDDSNSSSLNNKTKETTFQQTTTEISPANLKMTDAKEQIKSANKGDKIPVFDLQSRDGENEVEKELKFISANSVKQKVEQLNKTFAENSRPIKPPLRSSRSPESWKCVAYNVVNLPGRLSCSSCNAKKVVTGPNNRKICNETEQPTAKKENAKTPKMADDNIHYKALVELQDADLVPNIEPFTCTVCLVDYGPGEGVTLKDCLHTFCRTCLISTVQYSEDAEVKCPYLDDTYSCPSVLQQREIKALVPRGIFELHLAKSVKEAENKIENAFHCKTPDCKGWCIYEDNVNQFRCPVCKSTNCLTCQAIHNGINCKEYQERMKDASETDVDAKKTREMLNEMVEKGEAMVCPKCQVVLMKKWGCDWLKCSMCKTEICWVTRGFRWGPEGKGDTSGGCKCGLNGVKCHPKCNYCH